MFTALSPGYDVRELEKCVLIGPPIRFGADGVAVIEYGNCIPSFIAPLLVDEVEYTKCKAGEAMFDGWLKKIFPE